MYLTNNSSPKCGNWCDVKAQYPNDQHCDKISVNHVNLVQNRQALLYLTNIAPLNVEIGVMVKVNTSMTNIVIKSL